jgi:hypothetical protein
VHSKKSALLDDLSEVPLLLGCDFTSRPRKDKPITVAIARFIKGSLRHALEKIELLSIHRFLTFEEFEYFISSDQTLPGSWVGGFDLPFGLPRELVQTLNWPLDWQECMRLYASLQREQIRELFSAYCASRPAGSKFAHRKVDLIAKSSSSMKWVNPPVAYMMHAGIPILMRANLHMPGLRETQQSRVALESYPGMLAREILGRMSYKSDDKTKQTPERKKARNVLLKALCIGGHSLGLEVEVSSLLARELINDASGDSMDALLCTVQAAWGGREFILGRSNYGLPNDLDRLEGWILTC